MQVVELLKRLIKYDPDERILARQVLKDAPAPPRAGTIHGECSRPALVFFCVCVCARGRIREGAPRDGSSFDDPLDDPARCQKIEVPDFPLAAKLRAPRPPNLGYLRSKQNDFEIA